MKYKKIISIEFDGFGFHINKNKPICSFTNDKNIFIHTLKENFKKILKEIRGLK